MKTKLPLLLCILFLASAVNAQIPVGSGIGPGVAAWPRYTVKGDEFSVSLPTHPSMITRKNLLAGTNTKRQERVLRASVGNIEYSIYVFENPKPRKTLDEFIREQTANVSHGFVNERTLNIDGRAGKEYSYQINDKHVTEQFFAAEKRLYRFVATGPPADNYAVRGFFGSLAFGKKPGGMNVTDGPGETLTGGDGERIYTGRQVDEKARLISKPEPNYTESARSAEVAGVVILKVVFASSGKVTNIRVVQGLPYGLTERAIAAAKKIRFVPAIKDGKQVSLWMQLEYNFNLY